MIAPVLSTMNLVAAGGRLSSAAEAMKSVYQQLQETNHDELIRTIRPFFQMALNLMGASLDTDPTILSGSVINEDEDLAFAQQTGNEVAEYCIYLCQAALSFYLHNFVRARMLIERCIKLAVLEMIIAPFDIQLHFLNAMTAIGIVWKMEKVGESMDKEHAKTKKKLLATATECLARLQTLSAHCSDNIDHKAHMVEAELKALEGDIDAAMVLYNKAMEHAEKQGAMNDQALACERAGLALRMCGKEDDALDYLEDCCALYRQWGALIKVNHVKGNVIPQAIYDWEEEEG